ncbi:class I SAM-dependent methyltransferase [Roseibium sp.]|uniref:class I SAM-dependent methyltransferase n=1 Tax=Roseibium sp. TaxID=1936156 RepID=UPI003A981163
MTDATSDFGSGNARFWNRRARKYAAQPVSDEIAYEHTLERTRAHISGDDSVLEVGCGTGTTALKLSGSVASMTASDIAPEMIVIAREKQRSGVGVNVCFEVASLSDHLARGETYDAVLAFNLLHLVGDVPAELAKVHALLNEKGLFISKSACLGETGAMLRWVIRLMQVFGKAPPITFFSKSELEKMIEDAGFDIVETGTFPASPPARFIVARKT